MRGRVTQAKNEKTARLQTVGFEDVKELQVYRAAKTAKAKACNGLQGAHKACRLQRPAGLQEACKGCKGLEATRLQGYLVVDAPIILA